MTLRSFLLLFVAVCFFGCKPMRDSSELQEAVNPDPNVRVLQGIRSFVPELKKFRQRLDQDYVPIVSSDFAITNQKTLIRLKDIVEIQQKYGRIIDDMRKAGIEGIKPLVGIEQQETLLNKIFPASIQKSLLDYKADTWTGWAGDAVGRAVLLGTDVRGLMEFKEMGRRRDLWDSCNYLTVNKSYENFLNLISTNVKGVFYTDRYLDDPSQGFGSYIHEDWGRTLVWNLAGRPKVKASVYTGDLFVLDRGSQKTLFVDSGPDSLTGNSCTKVPAQAPEDIYKKYPSVQRTAQHRDIEINYCPQKFNWGSWTNLSWGQIVGDGAGLSSALSRIDNLTDIHAWFAEFCPNVIASIDELRIQEGPKAFNITWMNLSINNYKFPPGVTRNRNKKAVIERTNSMIEFLDQAEQFFMRNSSAEQTSEAGAGQ